VAKRSATRPTYVPFEKGDSVIRLEGLGKRFRDVRALDEITLEIHPGVFGLLGPNGAGKTTLLRILATSLPPTAGTATVCGHDVVRDRIAIRRLLGYLPQEYGAYPKLTGREYLQYIAILKGIRRPAGQIAQLLSQLRLVDAAHRKVASYSGGMLKRLGIAQALLGNPEVLLVDEPTGGLDPEERVRFREYLMSIERERVVVLSTHLVEDIAIACQHLAVLSEGTLRYQGTLTACGKRVLSTGRDAATRTVRILGPVDGGSPVRPTLEDAYLALIRP